MFNFKLKIRNEHKLHTKVRNEHSFSIKVFGATLIKDMCGSIRYTSKTIISEKMIGKMKGSLNYPYLSEINMKSWIKLRGLLKFTSTTALSVKSWLRASSNTPTKYAVTIKDILGVKSAISNKSTHSTKMRKDGVSARAVGNTTKYVCSAIATSVNHVIVKATMKNKMSSNTNIDNTKTHQYRVHKIRDFDGKKLNELPQDLWRCCYVVDQNWGDVGKIYKTWSDLKDEVTSWSDLK